MKLYFLIGDILAVGLTGALAGLVCVAATGVGWNMTLAMVWGMALGMALAMPLSTIMGIWFGVFEIMMPSMLGGMISGMVVAMQEAGGGVGLVRAATVGALWSLAALLATYVANAALRGEVKR